MNLVMNMVMSKDWNSQQVSYKDLKSNGRSKSRTPNEDGHEFLELLKKTQTRGPNTTSYPYDLVLIQPRIFEKGRMSYQAVFV